MKHLFSKVPWLVAFCCMFALSWAQPVTAPTGPAGSSSGPIGSTTLKPRSDNMYWLSDAPGANFDEKLKACYEASDAATPDLIRIHIDLNPTNGGSWVMKTPVDWKPRHGTQLRVWLIGDDLWRLIDWQGPSGTPAEILPIWRFWGLKESTFQLKGIGHSNYNAWFVQATDLVNNSSGNNHIYRSRFQPWDGTVGCVGFWIGYGSDKNGHNDNSAVQLEQCSFEFYPSGSNNNNGASGVMTTSCQAGQRAFVFSNYNTTANSMRDCTAVNAWGITTKSFRGQEPGGSSLVVDNFGTSGSPLVFDLNIGFVIRISGGRHELGGQALVQGFPAQPNGNAGLVTMEDVQFEDFRPEEAAPFLQTLPHSMMSLHDGSNVILSNVRIWGVGSLGQVISPDWMSCWCNKTDERPIVTITSAVVGNFTGYDKKVVPFKPKVREGTWKFVQDGATRTAIVSGQAVSN